MTRQDVIDILGHILVGAPHDEANEALAKAMDLLREDHSGDVTKMVDRSEDEIRAEFEAWARKGHRDVRHHPLRVSEGLPIEYLDSLIEELWEAWLSATRAAERGRWWRG